MHFFLEAIINYGLPYLVWWRGAYLNQV